MRFASISLLRLSLVVLAPVSLVLASAPAVAATTIDFDGTGAPNRFKNTTPLTDRYSDLGVTFSGAAGSAPGSILNQGGNFGIGSRSGNDFLAFNDFIMDIVNGQTVILPSTFSERISFSSAAMNFTLYVGSGPAATYTASFFDSANRLLETQVIQAAAQTYTPFTRTDRFTSVVIASSTGFWVADDLTFDLIVDPVPEPATWLMMILGFGMVGTALRRRRRFAALLA